MHPGFDLSAWRARIPLLAAHIPMNNCSHAPQSDATRAAAARYLDLWNSRGMDWEAWMAEVQSAKESFAQLINASPDDIAVCSSVSEAASVVASALAFTGPRRNVVVTEAEFPTIGHVWLAQEPRGAHVHWVPMNDGAIDLTSYDALLDYRTALVSACHGYYLNGALQDITQLAHKVHEHGALLFVDAYQTLGAVPVDVHTMHVDFLASGSLKYLMGVPGIAFLYVRRELIEQLRPTITGWFGRANPFAFTVKELNWASTASRFDTGTPPVINAYIARAGLDIVNEIGVELIRAWHTVLIERLIDGGRERGLIVHGRGDPAHKTANTAFVVPDAHLVEIAMRANGVIPSARGPVIRLAPHFYNTLDDCDTALDALVAAMRA